MTPLSWFYVILFFIVLGILTTVLYVLRLLGWLYKIIFEWNEEDYYDSK